MLVSLSDYTSDQRGDVGSWLRLAALKSLETLLPLLLAKQSNLLSQNWFDRVTTAVLKQTIERLDNVREEAGSLICLLLELDLGKIKLRNPELFEIFSWGSNFN